MRESHSKMLPIFHSKLRQVALTQHVAELHLLIESRNVFVLNSLKHPAFCENTSICHGSNGCVTPDHPTPTDSHPLNHFPQRHSMQAIELVQLAAMVATHGRVIVQSRVRFPDAALELYWTASKCRQERWSRTLKNLSSMTATAPSSALFCPDDERILDEVLTSEILVRVWAAICRANDRELGADDASPVAASVLAGHLDARHRVLNAMLYGYGLGMEQAVALNRRRLRSERWTDMLLAMMQLSDIADFGFEHLRIMEWSRAIRNDRQRLGPAAINSLTRTTLATAELKTSPRPTENADLNRKIACSILGCLPISIFDSLGTPHSPLQLSLYQGVADCRGQLNLIDANERIRNEWFRPRGNRMDSM